MPTVTVRVRSAIELAGCFGAVWPLLLYFNERRTTNNEQRTTLCLFVFVCLSVSVPPRKLDGKSRWQT